MSQLLLEQAFEKARTWAEKVIVVRSQLACSACHVYVAKDDSECPYCHATFANDAGVGR